MMVLITYDVNTTDKDGQKRLRRVAKKCVDYGQRVQNSVFECLLEPAQFVMLKNELEAIIDVGKDSLRYYMLGSNWKRKVEHVGAKETYDPEGAKAVLEAAGWVDSDGDGVREKDGQKLTIRWLTYPGRMELPLLAESAQATLGAIGFDVQVNSTANHADIRKQKDAWDVYVSAMVTAPTGDPEYFFTTECMDASTKNFGNYHSDRLESLENQLHTTFDVAERSRLATQMQQTILDDNGYFFTSFLTMGIVADSDVSGLETHPCDYYEITVDLDVS